MALSPQSRRGDTVIGQGTHQSQDCPHLLVGRIIGGSPDVFANQKSAAQHGSKVIVNCPHHFGGDFCVGESNKVFINNKPAHRLGDRVVFVCGQGQTITGSQNVFSG